MSRLQAHILMAALVFCWADGAAAQARDPVRAEVEREVARAKCTLNAWDVAYRGTLPGEARPVTVVRYGYAACGGGNNWGTALGVYVEDGASVRKLPLPGRGARLPESIERVSVAGGRILVEGMAYGPKDPHCCPSLRRRLAFVLRNGRLEAVR